MRGFISLSILFLLVGEARAQSPPADPDPANAGDFTLAMANMMQERLQMQATIIHLRAALLQARAALKTAEDKLAAQAGTVDPK